MSRAKWEAERLAYWRALPAMDDDDIADAMAEWDDENPEPQS